MRENIIRFAITIALALGLTGTAFAGHGSALSATCDLEEHTDELLKAYKLELRIRGCSCDRGNEGRFYHAIADLEEAVDTLHYRLRNRRSCASINDALSDVVGASRCVTTSRRQVRLSCRTAEILECVTDLVVDVSRAIRREHGHVTNSHTDRRAGGYDRHSHIDRGHVALPYPRGRAINYSNCYSRR